MKHMKKTIVVLVIVGLLLSVFNVGITASAVFLGVSYGSSSGVSGTG